MLSEAIKWSDNILCGEEELLSSIRLNLNHNLNFSSPELVFSSCIITYSLHQTPATMDVIDNLLNLFDVDHDIPSPVKAAVPSKNNVLTFSAKSAESQHKKHGANLHKLIDDAVAAVLALGIPMKKGGITKENHMDWVIKIMSNDKVWVRPFCVLSDVSPNQSSKLKLQLSAPSWAIGI